MRNIKLRFVKLEDAEELLNIYRPFVESPDPKLSTVSYEYIAPSVEEFKERIKDISAAFPYLVIEKEGRLLGYAYAHPYIGRAAYQWSAEVTIYLGPEGQGKGYGTILYEALEGLLKLQGVTNLYACIDYGNEASISFHRARGYVVNGLFKQCAFKNDMWLDMAWMEKLLPHPKKPAFIKNIHDIAEEDKIAILQNTILDNK